MHMKTKGQKIFSVSAQRRRSIHTYIDSTCWFRVNSHSSLDDRWDLTWAKLYEIRGAHDCKFKVLAHDMKEENKSTKKLTAVLT